MNEIRIVPAKPEDAEAILAYSAAVGAESDNLTFGAGGIPVTAEQEREFLASACASQTNRVDRGLKRASYYVLRETSCPAVLIKFGFLSNSGEAGEMLAETWQDAHAQLVADAVTRYAKRVEALDGAVAEKREADRKANEAWRAKLAQRNAAKRDAGQVATQPSKRPSSSGGVPQRLAATFPLAPFPSNDDQDEPAAQPPPPRPVAVERGTNTAPLVVGRLIDFYMKENPDK